MKEELLDIVVKVLEDSWGEVLIQATVNYKGNTFTAVGGGYYEEQFERPKAIKDAQEEAIKKARELAGLLDSLTQPSKPTTQSKDEFIEKELGK